MPVPLPPEKLKAIRPYVARGNQLGKHEPVIRYYCYYYAAKEAMASRLHAANEECANFTEKLLEELEQIKLENGDDELLTDDLQAQAYCEQFANKVFDNAAKAIESGRANPTTAQALLASLVFMEITKIFGELDLEIVGKIKYAKYHAARILRAEKDGVDPNAPIQNAQSPPLGGVPHESTLEPGFELDEPSRQLLVPHPHVEEVPDESIPTAPDYQIQEPPPPVENVQDGIRPTYDEPPHSTHGFPAPENDVSFTTPPNEPSSQIAPVQNPLTPPSVQDNGGYFPNIPAPTTMTFSPVNTAIPSLPPMSPEFQQPVPSAPPPPFAIGFPPQAQTATFQSNQSKLVDSFAPLQPRKNITPEEIKQAQKFAKWAISALEYEDVENAIQQFQDGLRLLGMRN